MSGKRERVIDAASKLFFEQGIADTGMEQVAEAASVSKMTLYNYFRNKEGLLREVTSAVMQKAEQDIERMLQEHTDPFEALIAMRVDASYLKVSDTFIKDLLDGYPELAAELVEFQTKNMAGKVEEIIFRSQQSGRLRKDVSAHVLYLFMMSVKEYMSRPNTLSEVSDIHAASEQVISLLYSGILSDEHRQQTRSSGSRDSKSLIDKDQLDN